MGYQNACYLQKQKRVEPLAKLITLTEKNISEVTVGRIAHVANVGDRKVRLEEDPLRIVWELLEEGFD